jgi:hypothetical protein
MKAAEILAALKQLGITAYVKGDKLICEPGSKLPAVLKPEIREHKGEIMALVLEEKARRKKHSGSSSVSNMQSLLGKDVAVGFYKPHGKGQPAMPLNGLGTTVLEASGLCKADCAHEFRSRDQETESDLEEADG